MKQTGFLFKLKPTDFIAGANSPLVNPDIMPSSDWRSFVPNGEKQYKYATFDTMSCTTFSALNTIETWVKYYKSINAFSPEQIAEMNLLGLFADGEFNASDRFTAIMSGTTQQGNYFQNVWDSIRKDGLLPEALFGFGGNSWLEYHNPANITDEMKKTALKILDILEFTYEWAATGDFAITPDFLVPHLKQAPLQGAIPYEASHAVELVTKSQYFDSYEPYLKDTPVVRYVLKPIVKVKKYVAPVQAPAYKYFKLTEKTGSNHTVAELSPKIMLVLDKARDLAGVPFLLTSGFRTPAENTAVGGKANSAHLRGLAADIFVPDNLARTKMIRGILNCGFLVFLEDAGKHLHVDVDETIHALGTTMPSEDE